MIRWDDFLQVSQTESSSSTQALFSNPPPQHRNIQSFLMSSTSMLRIASRAQPSTFFRSNGLRFLSPRSSSGALYAVPAVLATSGSAANFSTSRIARSDKDGEEAGHHEESFEEFTARYVTFQWILHARF